MSSAADTADAVQSAPADDASFVHLKSADPLSVGFHRRGPAPLLYGLGAGLAGLAGAAAAAPFALAGGALGYPPYYGAPYYGAPYYGAPYYGAPVYGVLPPPPVMRPHHAVLPAPPMVPHRRRLPSPPPF